MRKNVHCRSLSSIHILYNHDPVQALYSLPGRCTQLAIFNWTEVVIVKSSLRMWCMVCVEHAASHSADGRDAGAAADRGRVVMLRAAHSRGAHQTLRSMVGQTQACSLFPTPGLGTLKLTQSSRGGSWDMSFLKKRRASYSLSRTLRPQTIATIKLQPSPSHRYTELCEDTGPIRDGHRGYRSHTIRS